MKRHFIIAALALIITGFASEAQAADTNNGSLKGAISVHLNGGIALPVSGDYSTSVKTTDLLGVGPTFGLGAEYFITDAIGVGVEGNFLWNSYKDDYKIGDKTPARSVFNVSVNGIYDFRSMMPTSPIAPYAKAGVGLYMWNHKDDGIGGDAIKAPLDATEDFKGTSFGFNVGVGANYRITNNFEVGLAVDYNMFFPKDEDKFGSDFASQSYLSPSVKIAYYFK